MLSATAAAAAVGQQQQQQQHQLQVQMQQQQKKGISRQTSVCLLDVAARIEEANGQREAAAAAQAADNKAKKKANRSKRCKSLLMLSSPFTSSSSSVKSSLLSLWQSSSTNLAHLGGNNGGSGNDRDEPDSTSGNKCPPITSNGQQQQPSPPLKCVKMKLFEQPLDKLFSPKAMKQLNQAINSFDTTTANSGSHDLPVHHHFLTKRKRTSSSNNNNNNSSASLRKFTATNLLGSNSNLNSTLSSSISNSANSADANNNNQVQRQAVKSTSGKQWPHITKGERRNLLLACLPQPIRNLLNELYLRGPSTVGIFRKSPNARHCKELRQKLETDSQSSIEQFQVTVIASVFKEWLRSLPDCLLMSRLYPQWIDVAKLIEPLYQQPQQQAQLAQQQPLVAEQHLPQTPQCQSLDDSACDVSSGNSSSSARRSRLSLLDRASPLTDSGLANNSHLHLHRASHEPPHGQVQPGELDRARSCSTIADFLPINGGPSSRNESKTSKAPARRCDSSLPSTPMAANQQQQQQRLTAFASAAERHSECLRVVGQLLEAMNEPNLILLRSFVCVLWHIAEQSETNKMSAQNLGVCVGQSLLNDEHCVRRSASSQLSGAVASNTTATGGGAGKPLRLQESTSSGAFSKRHRRSRSQCLLSSTLSLTTGGSSSSLFQASSYLSSNGAQETAKYVPILVAFMIENAPALFGQDVTEMFGPSKLHELMIRPQMVNNCSVSSQEEEEDCHHHHHQLHRALSKELLRGKDECDSSFDHIDSGANSSLDSSVAGDTHLLANNPLRQQILVETCDRNSPSNIITSGQDHSTTTSILIVNPPPTSTAAASSEVKQSSGGQQRPLSASESTSSSRASSSTSGVHSSESPAFSSHADQLSDSPQSSTHTRAPTSCSSPSSVSSPSSASISASGSPVQDEECESSAAASASVLVSPDGGGSSSLVRVGRSSGSRQLPEASAIHHLSSSLAEAAAAAAAKQKPTSGCQPSDSLPRRQQQLQYKYSTFMGGVLNRVPKIPVQVTTSEYGGQAVIYNPRPARRQTVAGLPDLNSNPNSIIEVRSKQQDDNSPVISLPQQPPQASERLSRQPQFQQSASQQELREQRINQFLAHQQPQQQSQQQQPASLVTASASLPYLASARNYATSARQQQRAVAQQQALGYGHDPVTSNYAPAMTNSPQYYHPAYHPSLSQYQAHLQPPGTIFHSTTNLGLQQQQQQQQHQDRYLLYHRASLDPQRSHVMSLRNYYLSLHLQSQQQQQKQDMQLAPPPQRHYRPNTIHGLASLDPMRRQSLISAKLNSNISQSSQQHPRAFQQQFAMMSQRQPPSGGGGNLMISQQPVQRPQARLAKIRQNQFNGIYVKPAGASSIAVASAAAAAAAEQQQKTMMKPSGSSDDQLSDESDECSSEWAESTMV